jgi:hypothetical protein
MRQCGLDLGGNGITLVEDQNTDVTTLRWRLRNSIVAGPAIDGLVRLRPQGQGNKTRIRHDAFPSFEMYCKDR